MPILRHILHAIVIAAKVWVFFLAVFVLYHALAPRGGGMGAGFNAAFALLHRSDIVVAVLVTALMSSIYYAPWWPWRVKL